jgi:beta-N-acetylhexosaminidase
MARRRAGAHVGLCTAAAFAAACSVAPAVPSADPAAAITTLVPSTPGRATPSLTVTPTPAPCSTLQVISGWDLARRAAQLVVVPVDETEVGSVAPAVAKGAGGIILFGSTAPADLGARLHSLDGVAADGIAPLVMTDEEGGGVQRLANLVGSIPWPATMAATMRPSQVEKLGYQLARAMAANGVLMDLAPDADLASGPGPDAVHIDGPRSFSPSASTASAYALAFARGLEAGGVIPVLKHFPGEGAATANTDDRAASTPPLAALERSELLPFEAAIRSGAPAVMVGNARVPGLTDRPASLSPAVIDGLLRGSLGFTGLVLTDSLSAKAVSAFGIGVPEAAVEAVGAGADMVLFNSASPNATFGLVVEALVSAVRAGRISPERLDASVARVLATRSVSLCPAPRTMPPLG